MGLSAIDLAHVESMEGTVFNVLMNASQVNESLPNALRTNANRRAMATVAAAAARAELIKRIKEAS